MARPLRVNVPNGIYHVTSRGNRRQPIFLDDRDREVFLTMLATLSLRRHWRYHGYCLMPNHYHLVIETPQADLSSGMQYLNAGYADHFNFHHGTDGHLFQGRFHAVLVENDPHLLELARYLALNPRPGRPGSNRAWLALEQLPRHRGRSTLAGVHRCPEGPEPLWPRLPQCAAGVRPLRRRRPGLPSGHVLVRPVGV